MFFVACGGSKPKPAEPAPAPPPPAEPVADKAPPAAPEPPAPPPPPPPKTFHAKAALAPVKGTKLGPATVSFTQEEGKDTAVAAEGGLTGLAKGTYRLVVHQSADCGPNATKAGAAVKDAPDVSVTVGADKKGDVSASDPLSSRSTATPRSSATRSCFTPTRRASPARRSPAARSKRAASNLTVPRRRQQPRRRQPTCALAGGTSRARSSIDEPARARARADRGRARDRA